MKPSIRNWDKLAGWAAAEDKSAKRFAWLKQTAHLERTGEASLLNGTALENVLEWRRKENPSSEWAERYGGDFDLAMSFLDRSEQAKRKRRQQTILWRALVCATVVLALVLGSAGYATLSLVGRRNEARNHYNKYLERGEQRLEMTNKSPTSTPMLFEISQKRCGYGAKPRKLPRRPRSCFAGNGVHR